MASLTFLDGSQFPLLADRTVVGRRPWGLASSRAYQARNPEEQHLRFMTRRTDFVLIGYAPLSATHFEIVRIDIDGRTRFFVRDLGSTSGISVDGRRYNLGWAELSGTARLVHDWFTFEANQQDTGKLWKLHDLLCHACETIEGPVYDERRRALERDLTQAVRLAGALGFHDEAARIQRWAAHHLAQLLPAEDEEEGPPDLGPPPGF